MKVVDKYSHLNGEEFLLVHHKDLYKEILGVIEAVDACKFRTKISKEKGRKEGKFLWSPTDINAEFKRLFYKRGWEERRRDFYVSTDPKIVQTLEPMTFEDQKKGPSFHRICA